MSRRVTQSRPQAGVVVGPLRVDASPRSLARRLQAGDIAVIDVLDLDRTSAEALASRRPAAVINVQASISGRYPAGGPSVLAESGIPLIDEVGGAILAVREGTIATLDLAAADVRGSRRDAAAEPADPAESADPAEPAESAEPADPAESADPADPAESAEPADPAAPATGSNPLGRWWLERNQARTARKRASLTWLDELREADGEDGLAEDTGPRDAGTTSAISPSPEPAVRKPGKKHSAKEAVVESGSGSSESIAPIVPRRATVAAAGREFTGIVLDAPAIDARLAEAESGMATQLAVFTASAMDVVDRSRGALLEGDGLPDLGVDVKGKHVLVIAPGYEAAKALRDIKPYIRDRKPVVIAISEAADIARNARCQPAVIIGSTAAVSDASLKGARTVISHGSNQREGDVGEAKLSALGRDHTSSDLAVASEDLALLLARTGGAKTIVTVGVDATLLDFLESGRTDAAGTFLARLSAGARIIDARALASLYRPRWSSAVIVTGVVLAVLALAAALWVNGDSRAWLENALALAGTTG